MRVARNGLLVIALSGVALITADEGQNGKKPSDALAKFQSAVDSVERSEAHHELFDSADIEFIESLKSHENDDVAITAAFELLKRGDHVEVRQGVPEPGGQYSPRELGRFIGFVEGRLGIPLPKEWDDALYGSTANGFNSEDGISFWFDTSSFEKRADALLDGQRFEIGNTAPSLWIGSERCPLPDEVVDELDRSSGISGTLHGDHIAVLCPAVFPGNSALVCVNRNTGKVLWRQTVWAAVAAGGSSGQPPHHRAFPVIHGNTVYVFGACAADTLYIEGFKLRNGQPVVRFSSAY